MKNLVLRILITAFGLWISGQLIEGVRTDGLAPLLWASVLLGIANTVIKPILVIVTLPVTILSLGLFLLVINGAMVLLVDHFVDGIHVEGLTAAVLTSVILTIVHWLLGQSDSPRTKQTKKDGD